MGGDMTIVIRDAGGDVINIGPWDTKPLLNDAGVIVDTNPLPAGAVTTDEAVVSGRDGGQYAATDPRRNRKTVLERLDAIEARLP